MVDDSGGGGLCIEDVITVLQHKYAVITGGKTLEGYPIVTFPDSGMEFLNLDDEDCKKLMLYLTSVPSMQDADRGFVIIVDRRNNKWSSVKTVLLKISVFFPALIQVVFIIRPTSFLQKAISGVSNKFFKEDFKFKVVVCTGIAELHSHIDVSQLSLDLGGTIDYNHEDWIQQRTAVENFSANTQKISKALQTMIQSWQPGEMPNDVPSTLTVIEEHTAEYKDLKGDIQSSVRFGETLLSCIRRPCAEAASLELCPDKLINVAAVERLLIQLDETEKGFDSFWSDHEKKLKQCLELRKFECDFKEFQVTLSESLKKLNDFPNSGDSLSQVEEVLKDVEKFQQDMQDDLARAQEIRQKGEDLKSMNHYAVDSIIPKCVELDKMVDELKEQTQNKIDMLRKYKDLHEKIEKANQWCTQGVALLASHQIEKCSSSEVAISSLKEMEKFLQSAEEIHLNDPSVFHKICEDLGSPETRALVQQVLKRVDDMQLMCKKQKETLVKLAAKRVRPVQAVVPEPKVPLRVPARKHSPDSDRYHLRRGTKSLYETSGEGNSPFFRPIDSANNHSPSQRNSSEVLLMRQGHVITELIETEKTYVSELESILEGYLKQMENPAFRDLVPASLIGNADVLFGNMEEIFTFHNNGFLKDLQNCGKSPFQVGQCFVQRREAFHKLYSIYCLNKPKSESLRRQCGDDNPFFKECQKNLGHKLPLGAYLLKPVQRITKYQLLLQDLLKYCEDGVYELQQALDTMLSVLKYVNDSMHQIAITGFPGCLSDYGQLLLQGTFNVWMEKKKDVMKDLHFKTHQRYIFLYEHLVMFTKKYGKEESPSYAYKSALNTSQIGLTENMPGTKEDSRKFELWLHGRTQVHILQAPSVEVKNKWVKEIKKVLFQQFEHLKDENMKQYSDKILSLNGIISSTRHPTVVSSLSWDNPLLVTNNNVTKSSEKNRRASVPVKEAYQRDQMFDSHDDGWSTDELSQTEDEDEDGDIFLNTFDIKGKYVALGDYEAVDVSELSLSEGQTAEVEKIGCAGWWYVRITDSDKAGWVPASYLGPSSQGKRSYRSSPSVSSQDSGSGSLQHAVSKSSVASNMSTTSQEGANT